MTIRILLAIMILATTSAVKSETIYEDSLTDGWADWSWATVDLANSAPVIAGTNSIRLQPSNFSALYLHSNAMLDTSSFGGLKFWLRGENPQSPLTLAVVNSTLNSQQIATTSLTPTSQWQEVVVAFDQIGAIGNFDGFWIQGTVDGPQSPVYLDQIELTQSNPGSAGPAVTIQVSTLGSRRPINPLIYGVNFGDASRLDMIPYPLRRWGGNSTTRYNWRSDTNQTAADYFFQNIVAEVADENNLPTGSSSDVFVEESIAGGAKSVITVPTIGWTSKSQRQKLWSFSIAKYGPQDSDECRFYGESPPFWCSADAGNGLCETSNNNTSFCVDGRIVGNDPSDASDPANTDFVADWIDHLKNRFGTASDGGVSFYALDNEPMLWHETHRDVRSSPLGYDELWTRTVQTAQAIKTQDPSALVLGPTVWGWCAYFGSAIDLAAGGACTEGPDRDAHSGLALIPWYLEQICEYEQTNGVRLVDYLDIHFYPQGAVAGIDGSDSSELPEDAARRLRSVKELYDWSYVSESWIAEPVALIPRLRNWVAQHCPGTKIAITEYRWGADDGASGALAQAEVLAIFGREGVDAATRWVAPAANSRTEDAFRLYLNYDGQGAKILGASVGTSSSDQDAVASYAIVGDKTHVLLFNKSTERREATIEFDHEPRGTASLYGFDATRPLGLIDTLQIQQGRIVADLPPRSATVVVLDAPNDQATLKIPLLSWFSFVLFVAAIMAIRRIRPPIHS